MIPHVTRGTLRDWTVSWIGIMLIAYHSRSRLGVNSRPAASGFTVCLLLPLHGDLLRLGLRLFGDGDRQHPFSGRGVDLVGVDPARQRDFPVELPLESFDSVVVLFLFLAFFLLVTAEDQGAVRHRDLH